MTSHTNKAFTNPSPLLTLALQTYFSSPIYSLLSLCNNLPPTFPTYSEPVPPVSQASVSSEPKQIIVIDDDDDKLVMSEPVKKLKTERVSRRKISSYALDWLENISSGANVITIEDTVAPECGKGSLEGHMLANNSPLSTDESANGCQTPEINNQEGLVSDDDKEETTLEGGWECPIITFSAFDTISAFRDDLEEPNEINQLYSKTLAKLPKLNTQTALGKRDRKSLKVVWNPDSLERGSLEKYLKRLSKLVGQDVTHQENAIKLLTTFGMNSEEALKEVSGNREFYRNYFRASNRVLRSRISLLK